MAGLKSTITNCRDSPQFFDTKKNIEREEDYVPATQTFLNTPIPYFPQDKVDDLRLLKDWNYM